MDLMLLGGVRAAGGGLREDLPAVPCVSGNTTNYSGWQREKASPGRGDSRRPETRETRPIQGTAGVARGWMVGVRQGSAGRMRLDALGEQT